MQEAPSVGIRDLLVAAGVGVFAATSGWAIFIGREPANPVTTITIYDTGGFSPNPKWNIDEPTVQVRVRGSTGNFQAAYAKANAVKEALLGLPSQDLNGDRWVSVRQLGDIHNLGYDNSERPLFTINFRMIVEPLVGSGHRTAL